MSSHSHLVDGTFKSDKYPDTPIGKVPLSVNDPMAQDLLWEYAKRREEVDPEFSADLRTALANAGFDSTVEGTRCPVHDVLWHRCGCDPKDYEDR